MWSPEFVREIVRGSGVLVVSLTVGMSLGLIIAALVNDLGGNGDIAFHLVYLIASVYLFATLWQQRIPPPPVRR